MIVKANTGNKKRDGDIQKLFEKYSDKLDLIEEEDVKVVITEQELECLLEKYEFRSWELERDSTGMIVKIKPYGIRRVVENIHRQNKHNSKINDVFDDFVERQVEEN